MTTILVNSHVSAMEDTVGVGTPKPVAEFGPSSIPHTSPMDDMSYPRQELEFMTICYPFFADFISSGG